MIQDDKFSRILAYSHKEQNKNRGELSALHNSDKSHKSKKKRTCLRKSKYKGKFVNQGLFSSDDRNKINSAVRSLVGDIEIRLRESVSDPKIIGTVTTRIAAFISALMLLKGETRPSRIAATITMAAAGIVPEACEGLISGTITCSAKQFRYWKERFGFNPFSQQASFDVDDNDEKLSWMKRLPDVVQNWEAVKSLPAFPKISELISVMATMGFIDGKKLKVSIQGYELLRIGTIRKHADVTDLVSAILSSLEYFLSGAYEFFTTGNPRKFLFDDAEARDFDDLYALLLEATPHAITFNLPLMELPYKDEIIVLDDDKYLAKLNEGIDMCKKCRKIAKTTWQKTYFQSRLEKMLGWRALFHGKRSNGKFRRKPLSFYIYGKSGVGKSTLSNITFKAGLAMLGVPFDELDNIAPINEQDPYDSTITGNTRAYLTDDIANTKKEWLKTAPTQKIIDHNNNAPLFANKAAVEDKGVTPHNPDMTGYTGNLPIIVLAKACSVDWVSITRRMVIKMTAECKEEYVHKGTSIMDSAKILEEFPDDPVPDVWNIWLEEEGPNDTIMRLDKDYNKVSGEGYCFNIFEYLEYLYFKCDEHVKNQGMLQDIQLNMVKRLNFCTKCRKIGKMCSCGGEPTWKRGTGKPTPPTPYARTVESDGETHVESSEIFDTTEEGKIWNQNQIHEIIKEEEAAAIAALEDDPLDHRRHIIETFSQKQQEEAIQRSQDACHALTSKYREVRDKLVPENPDQEERKEWGTIDWSGGESDEYCKEITGLRHNKLGAFVETVVEEMEEEVSAELDPGTEETKEEDIVDVESNVSEEESSPYIADEAVPVVELIEDDEVEDEMVNQARSVSASQASSEASLNSASQASTEGSPGYRPAPRRWFRVDSVDENDQFEITAVHVPTHRILGTSDPEEYQFNATFADLINNIQYIPGKVFDMGDFFIEKFFTNDVIKRLYWNLWSRWYFSYIKNVGIFCALADFAISALIFPFLPWCLLIPAWCLLQVALVVIAVTLLVKWAQDRMELLNNIRGMVQYTHREIQKYHWKKAAISFGVGYLVYKMLKAYLRARQISEIISYTQVNEYQGNLQPASPEEVAQRDEEKSDWATAEWTSPSIFQSGRTATMEQLINKITKNLYHITFISPDNKTNKCDGLVIKGNNILVPRHVFEEYKELKVMCRRKAGDGLNTVYKGTLSRVTAAEIPGVDLLYMNAPFLQPAADLTHYFPISGENAQTVGKFVHRRENGEISTSDIRLTPKNHPSGPGFTYYLPYNTFNGLCMGVAVGQYDVPIIMGVHLMGRRDTPVGLSLTVTQHTLQSMEDILAKTPCLEAVSSGTFPTELYGKEIVHQSSVIHPKSPLRYMPKYSRIVPIGECPGRSSHTKSTVHSTCISKYVEQVFGQPNQWGAPKFNAHRQWQASLVHSANPSVGFSPELTAWAMKDYTDDLVTALSDPRHVSWIRKEFKPLNDMEILAGRDGVRFLDAIKRNTSKGFPLHGPKEEWTTRLEPTEEFNCPVAIRQEVWDRANEMCECFRNGERAYAIFKACVKDEPTKKTKDKVRVFQAADWAFQLLVRKYYLPLCRLMSIFPIDSECAVGINAHGPEWDQYAKHMKKFGADRILAGDYSKYDLRMPAQMLMATFKVFMDVCERCGAYSVDDLIIMKGIATEISYSAVAYNGDLILHTGSMPSGVNVTVYGNCVNNSLNLRCAFAALGCENGYTYDTLPKFKSVCAVGTYGDDLKGSVKVGYDWFNHVTVAEFLGKNDIVFTMPDKESEPIPFMKDEDADFLRRKNVYNPETGLIHGALDEESIFKSLHSVNKSALGQEELAIQNMQCALREWFHHGREVYERRQRQLLEVADKAGFLPVLETVDDQMNRKQDELYDTYDFRLEAFREKHSLK